MKTTRIHSIANNWRKNDDGCRSWYFRQGMGLSCRSPDSCCKRFTVDNASLKSERFLNGPVFPDFLREIHQFCLYRKYSDSFIQREESLSARSSILIQTSSPSCSSWDARNSGSFKKRSWIPWTCFLIHLLLNYGLDDIPFVEFSHICGHGVVRS